MSGNIDAMKQALGELQSLYISNFTMCDSPINIAITILRTAIEEAEKMEPVYSIEKLDKAYELGFADGNKAIQPTEHKPLFAEMIAEHEGLAEELNAINMGTPVDKLYFPPEEPDGHFLDFAYADSIAQVYVYDQFTKGQPFYSSPPTEKRPWIDLTPEEIDYWIGSNTTKKALCRAIQSALKDKNHA